MIPRLFESSATSFDNFGICPLVDCISCLVTEERNGPFTLTLEYKRSGMWAEELLVDRIILADPRDNAEMAEPFRIKEVSYDMLGNIVVEAEHISYQLNHIIVGANTQDPGTRYPSKFWEVENRYLLNGSNPFTFETDISDDNGTVYKYGCEVPTPLRKLLGGMKGSMIDLYGGELEFNRYKIILHSARGADNGVKIAYTKNLTGLNYSADLTNTVTGIIAYWKGTDDYVESSLQTVSSDYSFPRIAVVDASTDFDEKPSAADLNSWAANKLNDYSKNPAISADVEFVPLWQTEEYKEFWALEHVGLCDTVTVTYSPLNLELKSKVVKTIYDVLADRYESLTISTIRATLADTIYSIMKEIS